MESTLGWLLCTLAILQHFSPTSTLGVEDDRLASLTREAAQLTETLEQLSGVNEKLRRDLTDLSSPKSPQVTVHHHYAARNDCCLLDAVRNYCQKQVAGLDLCRLGDGIYYFSPEDLVRRPGLLPTARYAPGSIETAVENDLIEKKVLQLLLQYRSGGYWVSLNDQSVNQVYVWASTGEPTAPFFDWQSLAVINGPDESCVTVFRNADTKWDDRKCLETHRFVCEVSKPCLDLLNVTKLC